MELIEMDIRELKPAPYNPRFMKDEDYDRLENSMDEFGVVDPIIFEVSTKEVIGGHKRLEVLLRKPTQQKKNHALLLGDVGWFFTDDDIKIKSEEHKKALNVALNKIMGEFEEVGLTDIFMELEEAGFDIGLTGFDELEIEALLEDDIEGDIDDFERPEQEEFVLKFTFDELRYHQVTEFFRQFNSREEGLLQLIKDYDGEALE